MNLQVWVNGRALARQMTGIERYASEILGQLGERVQVVRPDGNVQGLRGHAWEQLTLPGRLNRGVVLWSPANTGPLSVSNQVLTLHDLSPLEHPEWFKPAFAAWYRLFLPALVRRVRCVLTLSEHVRGKVLARFNLPPDCVRAIPPGVDQARFRPSRRGGIQAEYLLFVGSLEPRKNLTTLLAAWKEIAPRHPRLSLILAGVSGRVFRPVRWPADLERVRFVGYVSEARLPVLYAGARALVLPSYEEGFGLPVLEAMACGTPVVASTGGALPEVVGPAGLLFDPQDAQALAQALERCLLEPGLGRALSEQGLARARQYSWRTAAEQVWQTLRRV